MFNLEQAITDWRQKMLSAGIKSPVPLDELESHLRDVVEQQIRSGISMERAFEMAVQAMGEPNALKSEFVKASVTNEAHERKLLGIVLLIFGGIYCLFGSAVVVFKLGSFERVTFTEQALSLAALAFTVLLCGSAFFARRFLPVIPNRRVRAAVCISGGILVAAWFVIFYYVVLIRFDFTISQLVVACLWAMSPTGAFAALVIGLEHAAADGKTKIIREF